MINTNEITNQLNKKSKTVQILMAVHTHTHLILKSEKIMDANFVPYCDIKNKTKLYESLTGFT